ncbi:MAG TPA: PIG-L deacetylase family protein [Acidimicrobiales bacterium]|nr:PIG-L deacetylase family protein [Acidimicrobiales bacterium]
MNEVARVLVVTAHPDDVDFGAAGTVARWREVGVEVAYLVCTDGEAGGSDRALGRAELAAVRREEQRRAAAAVGVETVEFLGRPDGSLAADLELRREIAAAIRRHRPDRVLCQSPERDYTRLPASHPDHLAAGAAAVAAVYPDARNPFAFPELLAAGLEPHAVGELWLMAHPLANHHVDVTEHLEAKLAALHCHESQLPDPAAMDERIRSSTARNAEQAGMAAGRHAEAFFVTTLG